MGLRRSSSNRELTHRRLSSFSTRHQKLVNARANRWFAAHYTNYTLLFCSVLVAVAVVVTYTPLFNSTVAFI